MEVPTTTKTIKTQRNNNIGITFRTFFFFQLMDGKNIDSQSEPILLIRVQAFKAEK